MALPTHQRHLAVARAARPHHCGSVPDHAAEDGEGRVGVVGLARELDFFLNLEDSSLTIEQECIYKDMKEKKAFADAAPEGWVDFHNAAELDQSMFEDPIQVRNYQAGL